MNGMCSRTIHLSRKLSQLVVGIGDHGLLSVIELCGLFRHTVARIVFEGAVEHVGRSAVGIAFALRQQISDQIVSAGRAEDVALEVAFHALNLASFIVVIEGAVILSADRGIRNRSQLFIGRKSRRRSIEQCFGLDTRQVAGHVGNLFKSQSRGHRRRIPVIDMLCQDLRCGRRIKLRIRIRVERHLQCLACLRCLCGIGDEFLCCHTPHAIVMKGEPSILLTHQSVLYHHRPIAPVVDDIHRLASRETFFIDPSPLVVEIDVTVLFGEIALRRKIRSGGE